METSVFNTTSTASSSASIVNSIDASQLDKIAFTTLPSTRGNAAALRPLAVFDKEKEVNAIVAAADALKIEHEAYENQYVEGGRKALYSLLAKIYALAIQVNNSDYVDSILKALRNKLTYRNVRVQKNTNAVTVLVKWVVGVNRQTAHNYSKALQTAFNDNISAEEFSDYFTKRGGLQAAKAKGAKKTEDVKKLISQQVERYIENADKNHELYENTKIKWTEIVLGDRGAEMMMILGHSNGGGSMNGLRAFYLSDNSYKKICRIIGDEIFNAKTVDAVALAVDKEYLLQKERKQKAQ